MSSQDLPHLPPQKLTILGATGSIGLNTLDVVSRHPDSFEVYALTAQRNVTRMAALCQEYKPAYAVMTDADSALQLRDILQHSGVLTEVLAGTEGLCEVAAHDSVDIVMAAIVGAAGLLPTLAAVKAGKRVLLANKEALVMSGQLFIDALQHSDARLLPVDSEHNAIFQALPLVAQQTYADCLSTYGVRKILLTGSGGPFLDVPLDDLYGQLPEAACNHPNWSMGRKISVDSATMLNKGLEYIEARWLFNAQRSELEIVVHPQSVVHSMVQYCDGSVIAQLGQPDMRTPIAYCLGYPERIESGVSSIDFAQLGALTFAAPDMARYPLLQLAIDACWEGQAATTSLNAANEIAVDAFLGKQIQFGDIARICLQIMEQGVFPRVHTLDEILALDQDVRMRAKTLLGN